MWKVRKGVLGRVVGRWGAWSACVGFWGSAGKGWWSRRVLKVGEGVLGSREGLGRVVCMCNKGCVGAACVT